MTPGHLPFLRLLYTALHSPPGIRVVCAAGRHPRLLTSQLSSARLASKDPALKAVSIRTSLTNPTTEVWLVVIPQRVPTPEEELADSLVLGDDSPVIGEDC